MIYNDGFQMDDNLRVTRCPKCGNEQFDDDAEYCRICGTPLFNICEGQEEWDNYGNVIDRTYHRNYGNSRFCERCGKPTGYFKLKLLRPYDEVEEQYKKQYSEIHSLDDIDTDDLPF